MPRSIHLALALLIATLLVAGPWWYKLAYERHYRSFHVVQEGVLYRSGQLDVEGLKRIVRDYRIKTIISLRDKETQSDLQEVEWADKVCLNHVRIPPRPWSAADGSVPAEEGLATFRRVMDDPANYPVLIHCFAGIHRTGAYCAVFRIDYHGWTNREAIAEMRTLGYVTLDGDQDILAFLEHYRPAHGEPNGAARDWSNRPRPLTDRRFPQ
jgi:protein tyrosine/serine phosphatase